MKKQKVLNQASGDNWQIYNADCIEAMQGLPSNSIDLTVSSPPFGNLYIYSPSSRDMGNVNDDAHFFEHFSYLIPELHRITTPGRLAVMHCKHLPLYKGSSGVAGFRDFVGELVRHFTGTATGELLARLDAMQEARAIAATLDCDLTAFDVKVQQIEDELLWAQSQTWVFHSLVTIWKCPKTEMERTNNHGLLHSQLCKDSSVSRQGMADYLVVLRKWSDEMTTMNSVKPINRLEQGQYRFDVVPYIGEEPPSDRRLRWSDRDGISRYIADNGVLDPRDFSIKVWQKYASPVWFDMKQTNVLNTQQAKEGEEPHICLAKGSLVLTKERGYVTIESIEIGELVLTHKGRWQPVLAKQKTGDDRPVVQLKAQGVANLVLTPDHKVWTRYVKTAHTRKEAMRTEPDWVRVDATKGSYVNLKLPPVVEGKSSHTEADWRIIGRWLADGHIDQRGTAHISCGSQKLEVLTEMLGDRFGSTHDTGTSLQLSIKDIGGHIRHTLKQCGHGAHNKHLPPEAFTLPVNLAKALLEGYLSGDGYYLESREKWMASSVSRGLLLGLAFLVQRVFGTVASVYAGREPGQSVIEGRTVNTKQDWVMCFNATKDFSAFITDDGAWKKVRSVKSVGTAETWNLHVAEDNSYTAEGCIVKNCPLQLDVVARSIEMWSNPGDVVFDPFNGLGSTGYAALKMGRKYIGTELKESYFNQACRYLSSAEHDDQLTLSSLSEVA
jgi:hypothetical protein